MLRRTRCASIVALSLCALFSPRTASAACTIAWDGGAGTTAWAAPTNWDTNIVPGGTATLGGTLRLTFVNGFVPHHGDTFTILTAGTRIGTFSNVDVVGYPDCLAQVTYNPTSVVIQIDPTPPNAVCQNLIVPLDATGHVSITAAQVGGGSTDNCAIAGMEVAPSSFDCTNLGPNPVLLTVTDFAGNTATCNATITVQDVSPPIITCRNLTASLNNSGAASIAPAQVYVSGTDNCGTLMSPMPEFSHSSGMALPLRSALAPLPRSHESGYPFQIAVPALTGCDIAFIENAVGVAVVTGSAPGNQGGNGGR